MSEYVVLDRLFKKFGSLVAVNGISLQVNRGEVFGFIGPNGAGKSTAMKMATGFLDPDGGAVTICGIQMAANAKEAKRRIGYLPEGAPAYGDMTPRGFLGFIAAIRGFDGRELRARVDEAAARAELGGVMDQRIETLSKGFKRRVGLAQAILHHPEVLILDEPTDGLDPNQKFHVRSLIEELSSDTAIIISTHILEEVEAVCSRVALIARGEVVFDGTARALQALHPHHNAIELRLSPAAVAGATAALEAVPAVASVETVAEANGIVVVRAMPREGRSIAADVATQIAERNIRVEELTIQQGRLDDVFRNLTTTKAGASDA